MNKHLLIALSAILFTGTAFAGQTGVNVVYGEDNRKDLYEVTNPMYLKLARSTVALVKTKSLAQNSSGTIEIKASSFQQVMGVCKNEPFFDQPSGGFCSGSLIGKNMILTAGHCIKSQSDCMGTSFVFDYAVSAKGKYPRFAKEADVYKCSNVIHTEAFGNGSDFAIVTLDREVTGREPLELARERSKRVIPNGTELLMIGHPAGLPTKFDDGGKVRSNNQDGFFVATTDSYGGNSGSAVFNKKTGKIEGVLVRGETDYVYANGCRVSKVCSETTCRGEDVTKISSVLPYLN